MISNTLKKRFCKDNNIGISVMEEPYFTERLYLIKNEKPDILNKWEQFLLELHTIQEEQKYFSIYNATKDEIINHIKNKPEYEEFNKAEIISVDNKGVGENNVFNCNNLNKRMLSLDLKKGNFTAMKFFNKNLVDNKDTYEEFVGQFTQSKNFIESKYIRQVIFGACNPKRQVKLEKYIMSFLFNEIHNQYSQTILFFSNDEIVMDITSFTNDDVLNIKNIILSIEQKLNINIHQKFYSLEVLPNSNFMVQRCEDGTFQLRNVPAMFYPFVMKHLLKQEITENDKVFFHEGYLSKLITYPTFI